MHLRAAFLVPLLLLAACGGKNDTPGAAAVNDVGAKASADVDAAMADALRTRTAPPAAAPSTAPARP